MKKISNKKLLMMAVLVFVLGVSFKIGSMFLFIPIEVKELKAHITFTEVPFEFGQKLNEKDIKKMLDNGWIENYEYSGMDYSNDNIGSIIIYGFPDLSNTFRFNQYITSLNNMSIFGISVGSDINVAIDKLKSIGYKQKYDDYFLVKGRVEIILRCTTDKKIDYINVSLRSSDWFYKGYYK
jgi:hypothetical protein